MTGLHTAAIHGLRLAVRAGPVRVSVYLVTALAEAIVPIAVAWLMKLVLDWLASGRSVGVVTVGAAALATAGLGAAVLQRLSGYMRNELSRRMTVRALDDLFAATARLVGLARFEDPAFLNRLRLAQQSTAMVGPLLDDTVGLASGAVAVIGFIGTLVVLSPLMTELVLASAVPSLIAQLALSRGRATAVWAVEPHQRREFFYGQLLGSAAAAKEIRLFGLAGFFRGRMLDERHTSNAALRRVDRRELLVQGLLAVGSAVLAGIGLIVVVAAARRSELTTGDVAMFVAAVTGVQMALDGVVRGVALTHQQLTLFGHYVDVLLVASDIPVAFRPVPLAPLRRGVEFRDVWFRYGEDHPWVLRGVNLTIPYGRAVALVGLNGAGKSTLVKLLCRLYDPNRGSITWDGVDLREVDPARLRDRISAVFQDHMNYDLTAAENIALGDLTALHDLDRVRVAAVRAGADETLATLPRGYDTPLTRLFDADEVGVVLSGGQWQRVALARAFVRDGRDLMILDEPTSGLDPQSEHDLHASIGRYRAGATSLLISHRLSAIRDADTIAVLDDGVIREYGDHIALMAADGAYAQLFRLQAEGYTLS